MSSNRRTGRASRVIGYVYEAAVHCPPCARMRFAAPVGEEGDEHGVDPDAVDREGNVIGACFSTDEVLQDVHCDACGDEIALA